MLRGQFYFLLPWCYDVLGADRDALILRKIGVLSLGKAKLILKLVLGLIVDALLTFLKTVDQCCRSFIACRTSRLGQTLAS